MSRGQGRRPAAIGALLQTSRLAKVDEVSTVIAPATHNEAEYQGLIEGLKLARRHGVRRIRIYMDSELVVDQVNERAEVREARLVRLHGEATALLKGFDFRLSWVPRTMNRKADQLASDALAARSDR